MLKKLLFHEDVGRHNAVDKIIGAMLRNLTIALLSAIFIFSIPTIELMQKTMHDTQLIVLLSIYGLFGSNQCYKFGWS